MIGKILGDRYEIQEKIGEGGMAIVYKARCNKLNRFVAVKILKNEFANNAEIVAKFTREATAIAALSDPNIVNVLDVGKQDDLNYIVMEYVNGKTLKEIIKECGNLSFEATLTVGLQIAKALDCAHRNSIIHRDVKPQNILVTNEGMVKVTDFGIAKSASSATITNTTTIMGSAHYFSPEQAKGSMVDARTDLYSLGVVLYEMVTGKVPFEADSPVSIALKHIQEEVVPPKNINSKIPDSLNNLIVKAMQKEPARRYQSAKEMIFDLDKIKNDPNAFINVGNQNGDSDHTIVMSPVKPSNTAINMPSNDYDEEYGEYDDYDEYDEDPIEGNKKSKKKLIIVLVSVFVALGIIFAASYMLFAGNSIVGADKEDVVVPDITGMTLEEAKKELKKVGLELVDRGSEKSDEPEGTIIGVDPKEGTKVKEGSKVNVITSDGSDKVTMKNFAGSLLSDVKDFLDKNNIKYEILNEPSDEIEAGAVIRTDPGEGEGLSSDVVVKIYVSSGPETKSYIVPSVVGLTEEIAKTKLVNFDVNVIEEETTAGNVGKVLKQTNAGKKLEGNSTVTITVGIEAKAKDVSSIISKGMKASEAKSALEAQGYSVMITGSASGVVKSWTPSSVKQGGTVVIVAEEEKVQQTPSDNGDDPNDNNTDNDTDKKTTTR